MYTLQGKTQTICHVRFPHQSTHVWRTLSVGSPRTWQPFTGSHEVKTGPYTRKKSWQSKTDWVASFFLPCDNLGVGERGFSPMITQLLQLTGHISLACDRYVQYLLTGANPFVLNRHRRGLQPWRCRLATDPLPDLPNQLSSLSPNGPVRSPF
jgi:hypothetical protein